ncbi:CPBP family intramembrane glutamic endopeptidase [Allomuricauda sp. F6463D]|uniref:CPBP family intramembrane glutamic endopeptidase n=1 Tax=Allomuricauda sp. F6463D TaxID=2926409 RepID=UPI001FF38257|nr:type II CAAX endopeptidase family protein [Muricauda sp. F6463D]MCK0160657.1 CPBP family intramembrane metalloprotease [Muricauda sp. F6463D]
MDFFNRHLKITLSFNWKLGLAFIFIFGVPRFLAVLNASKTGDYGFTSIIFVVMWITPFLLLTKQGRTAIGIKKPDNYSAIFLGFILGGLVCLVVWLVGTWLYNDTVQNWLVYISRSYQVPMDQNFDSVKLKYFIIFGVTSMIFSPIGEEFLYRGLIHRCFSEKFGENKASIIDSLAFGLTHLAHFGILFIDGRWVFYWIPAILWVMLMFFASRVFFMLKQKSNSIWGATLCHAGFNLMMTYLIFYHIF